jgi:hypothetical protein
MAYTWKDFERDYVKRFFPKLTPQEKEEALKDVPVEERLQGLSEEQIRQYLEKISTKHNTPAPKKRRKK